MNFLKTYLTVLIGIPLLIIIVLVPVAIVGSITENIYSNYPYLTYPILVFCIVYLFYFNPLDEKKVNKNGNKR